MNEKISFFVKEARFIELCQLIAAIGMFAIEYGCTHLMPPQRVDFDDLTNNPIEVISYGSNLIHAKDFWQGLVDNGINKEKATALLDNLEGTYNHLWRQNRFP